MNLWEVNQNRLNWLLLALILTVFTFMLTSCGFEVVSTGARGIKVRYGEVIGKPLSEGLYFYNPVTSSIHEYSVQQETWKAQTAIFTLDTQNVLVEFAVTFYPDPEYVGQLYKEFGNEKQLLKKVIEPVVLGSLKDAVGEVRADDLVGKREAITKRALKEVAANLSAQHVIATNLQLTNLDFDDAYEKAVEEKVVAIQNAQKAKNVTVQIKEEAEQTVTTARAAAEAMKIKSAALAQNKGLVQFEAVQKWDGKLPQYMFGSQTTPFIDMRSLGKSE